MTSKLVALVAFGLCLFVTGCTEDQTTSPPPPPPNTGSANFARYVAIGNSFTAGFQSNALSQRDQVNSYSNLIAGRVQTTFEQPLMMNPGIGSRIRLVNLAPTLAAETGVNPFDPNSNLNVNLARPYNNLGIPGAILYDVLDTTGASSNFVSKSIARGNPFFAQILRTSLFGNSIYAQAKVQQPTFMTVWIGNNDVLGYATSGGRGGTNVGPPYSADPPRTKPTEAVLFSVWYRAMMDSLKTTGADIVTANIPDVTSIPFFTTIGPQIRVKLPTGVYFRYQRNGNNGPSNPLLDTTRFTGVSSDPLILLSGSSFAALLGQPTGKWYTANGISPLPPGIDTTKPFGLHPQNPWPHALTLDAGEQAIAQAAVTNFNNTIDSVATNRGIAVVNMNAALGTIRSTGVYDPALGTFSSAFILGGAFSYDGVHPSSRGAGIVANEWIKTINTKFGASIPLVALASLPGIPIGKTSAASFPDYQNMPWGSFIELMTGGSSR